MRLRDIEPGWRLGTGILALVLGITLVPTLISIYSVPANVAAFAGVCLGLGLILAIPRPILATALQSASVIAIGATARVPDDQAWPLTIPSVVALLAHLALLAFWHERRTAIVAWLAMALTSLMTALVFLTPELEDSAATTLSVYLVNSGLTLVAGTVLRRNARVESELARTRMTVAADQERRAAADQRTQIARDMHDIVAHGMSVVHMQASSAVYRLTGLDIATKNEFNDIARKARESIAEMHHLLAVLRDNSYAGDRSPTPGLAELETLVATARGGVEVSLDVDTTVEQVAVSESVGLVVYRILQEALSNVMRHAPGATAQVTLEVVDSATLVLTVQNQRAPSGRRLVEHPSPDKRPRHGLTGMRERAALVGGSVSAGPRDDGGYTVHVSIPVISSDVHERAAS